MLSKAAYLWQLEFQREQPAGWPLLLLLLIVTVIAIPQWVWLPQLDAEAGRAAADQVVLSAINGLQDSAVGQRIQGSGVVGDAVQKQDRHLLTRWCSAPSTGHYDCCF
jgi:hypothetical protein